MRPERNEFYSRNLQMGGVENFIKATGVKSRRCSYENQTTSDLCYEAAACLIKELGWSKTEIEALVFVTQTPDYLLPATSCVLQKRLGLSNDCFTLDVSLGCSGWVYALSVLSSLMQNGTMKRGILLAGDTITKICSPEDKSTFPLFGDAGTATALEYETGASGFKFVFNTDGSGAHVIMSEKNGFRKSEWEKPCLKLDGGEVFSFGAFKAPKQVNYLFEKYNITAEEIDIFTFHQANMMMNEMIRKKLKLTDSKVPYSMDEYGNTSSASIPLTLVTRESERLRNEKLQHIACGFGVGLSWASVWFETNRITVPPLIES